MTYKISETKFTNKQAGTLFFTLFIVFFVIFILNQYTMNIIMAIIMLQFSLHFKQAQIIREVQEDVINK